MEIDGSIVESFKGKCLLITGATGFLAKIFVEKVLRVQPQVKKLYLLLRAPSSESANQRLQEDVLGKKLFEVLREKHGLEFEKFMNEKVQAVAGDISKENLGIEDEHNLRETLWNEVDIVVNVAATTNFFERYDVALRTNVLGAKHALELAKKCAYVAGSQEGLILEKQFKMGETLNGNSTLDIEIEMNLMEETLKELQAKGASKQEEKDVMRQLGLSRAKIFGWPNTYVFTKAMAEMLLEHERGNIPLVVIRPTIITSIYSDPISGWMEGIRTIDGFIVGYGKGKVSHFLVDVELIMDAIPGDMVSNAMIIAIAAHINQPIDQHVYHVGSSVRNPVKYSNLIHSIQGYFAENPEVGKDGKIIKPHKTNFFSTLSSFQSHMNMRYKLPLKGLRFSNAALCNLLSGKSHDLQQKFNFAMRMAELYGPFSLFKGVFDDKNSDRLRSFASQKGSEESIFSIDPKVIDWNQYLYDVHIPGVLKYACK